MIMSMKNEAIGNRTCELPAFSAVPQPTAPPRVVFPVLKCSSSKRNIVVFCVITVNVLMLIV